MASSLQVGLAALDPACTAAVVVLGDGPALSAEAIRRVAVRSRGRRGPRRRDATAAAAAAIRSRSRARSGRSSRTRASRARACSASRRVLVDCSDLPRARRRRHARRSACPRRPSALRGASCLPRRMSTPPPMPASTITPAAISGRGRPPPPPPLPPPIVLPSALASARSALSAESVSPCGVGVLARIDARQRGQRARLGVGAVDAEALRHHDQQRVLVDEAQLGAEEARVGLRLGPQLRHGAEVGLVADDRDLDRQPGVADLLRRRLDGFSSDPSVAPFVM